MRDSYYIPVKHGHTSTVGGPIPHKEGYGCLAWLDEDLSPFFRLKEPHIDLQHSSQRNLLKLLDCNFSSLALGLSESTTPLPSSSFQVTLFGLGRPLCCIITGLSGMPTGYAARLAPRLGLFGSTHCIDVIL
jgi:hypothetical protein